VERRRACKDASKSIILQRSAGMVESKTTHVLLNALTSEKEGYPKEGVKGVKMGSNSKGASQ